MRREGMENYYVVIVRCNISSMRRSVSSPDETLRRGLKNKTRSGVFLDERRGVSSGDETLCRMLDITSQTNDFRRRN